MSAGLLSGVSSGLGQSLGTSAAGSAAGQAAASTAAGTTAGSVGSAIGSAAGGAANKGALGDISRLITNDGSTAPAEGTTMEASKSATAAADPSKTKGGWAGTGLFGNDQYNPNPSSYQPATGGGVAQAAMPKPPSPAAKSIAMQLLGQLPTYNQ